MTRLSYRLYLLATAVAYRLPRRLTKGGLLMATGLVLAGAIGSDVDQSVAFQAFAVLFSVLALSMLWAPFFRGRFRVARRLPRLASIGQPFRYRVTVQNLSSKAHHGLELLEDLADPRPNLEEFARLIAPGKGLRAFRLASTAPSPLEYRQAIIEPANLPDLRSGGSADAELEIVPLRRGPLRFRGISIARSDPLGLFRGWVRLPLPGTVLVLPRRYPVPRVMMAGTRNYQPGGVPLASSVGESEEFVSLREYRPGDPFRKIHWRSSARAGRPIVKEHQDEFFARSALVLDTLAAPEQAVAFEEAVAVAASFACAFDAQETLLDLLFVGSRAFCFTCGRGLGQAEQVLEILASVKPGPEDSFESLHEAVLRHAELLSGCICVFINWDKPRRELLRQLRARGIPVLALLVADRDTERRLTKGTNGPLPAEVHVLRPGKVAEGLQALEKKAL